jgi:hypothetical protein
MLPNCVWIVAGESGIARESPDQKSRDFVFQIALPRWFSERAHQMFGKMTEDINCSSI